jgi:spore coat protein SA
VFRLACDKDVIYVHNRPEIAAGIAKAYPKRTFRLVLHMHNSHLLNYPEGHGRSADLTVFCSEFLRTEARKKLPGLASAVVPNGADEQKFYPALTPALPTILFVGRLVPEKGIDVFLSAMRLLPEAKAFVVGSTGFGNQDESEFLRKLKRDAPHNVTFSKYTSGRDLAEKFRSASIFCCPSTFNEPFGMVNVEAMACGLPVVATRVGGIPEVFREGGALLVPPRDSAKLAQALRSLLDNPALRRDLAQEGLASFQRNFRWQSVRSQYQRSLSALGNTC